MAFYAKNTDVKSVSGYDGGMAVYGKERGDMPWISPKFWENGSDYPLADNLDENPTLWHFRERGYNPDRPKQDRVTFSGHRPRVQRGKGGYSPEW